MTSPTTDSHAGTICAHMPADWAPLRALGGRGHLAVLLWGLVTLFAFPGVWATGAASLVIGVNVALYRGAFRRLVSRRVIVLLVMMFLLTYFLVAEGALPGRLHMASQMMLRAIALLTLVQGVASSVQITELAGVFERFGLHGLGFSLGVALNVLPSIQDAGRQAWFSLRLRGGLRHKRLRALRLMAVTVACSALRRAEETALAAEARAFDPAVPRSFPLSRGRLDMVAWVGGAVCLTAARVLIG